MWIMTTRGFFSAVQHRDDERDVLIRARSRADLVQLEKLADLVGVIGLGEMESTPPTTGADYPWRVRCTKQAWGMLLMSMTAEVEYDNFKDAVSRANGNHRRHDTYLRVWHELHNISREPDAWPMGHEPARPRQKASPVKPTSDKHRRRQS